VAGILEAGARGSSRGLEPVLLAVLDWLQHVASWADRGPQGESGLQELTDLAAALSAALACTDSHAAAVRCTALSATRAWVSTSAGSAALLQDAGLSVALFRAALLHLTDLHAPAASEAEQLLLAAAAPLALSGALCPVGSGAECRVTDSRDAAAAALEPQQLQFRPVQLQHLLSYLSPGSLAIPTVLSSGEQLPVNSPSDWLPRMLHYARGASPSTPPAHNRRAHELPLFVRACSDVRLDRVLLCVPLQAIPGLPVSGCLGGCSGGRQAMCSCPPAHTLWGPRSDAGRPGESSAAGRSRAPRSTQLAGWASRS
jgi:hypothetical protein